MFACAFLARRAVDDAPDGLFVHGGALVFIPARCELDLVVMVSVGPHDDGETIVSVRIEHDGKVVFQVTTPVRQRLAQDPELTGLVPIPEWTSATAIHVNLDVPPGNCLLVVRVAGQVCWVQPLVAQPTGP
jgi:hypothetical protein